VKKRLVSLSLLFSSCFFDTTSERSEAQKAYALLNNAQLEHSLYANDLAIGDSVVQRASKGWMLYQHKGATYTLTWTGEAPGPQFHIYPISGTSILTSGQTLEMTQTSPGVWKAAWTAQKSDLFVGLISNQNQRAVTVSENLRLEAQGTNPPVLNLHLVFFSKQWTPSQQQELQAAIDAEFAKLYGPYGITVQVAAMSNAGTHPTQGNKWSQGTTFLLEPNNWNLVQRQGGQSQISDMDLISEGWNTVDPSLLEIAVVDSVQGNGSVIGISPFNGLSLIKGMASTVVLSTYINLGKQVQRTTNSGMATTLAHELGHFLGLRHTTIQGESTLDLSIVEDGLMDTPFSPDCRVQGFSTGLIFSRILPVASPNFRNWVQAALDANCPDQTNLLFPVTDGVTVQDELSPMQAQILKANLSVLPRQ
jgi:hypothetical protein